MKWFKHFNDTIIGDTMQHILGSGRNGDKAAVLFFYILETLSRKNSSGEIELNIQQTARRLHTNSSRIVHCLDTLSSLSEHLVVTYPTLSGDQVKSTCKIFLHNWRELQDVGDKNRIDKNKIKIKNKNTNDQKQKIAFDLESVYQKYPRKLGKQKGFEKLKRDVKTEADYQALDQAVTRFVKHHEEKQTEAQFIPHFSTWVSSWRDWLDPEIGTASVKAAGDIDWSFLESSS